MSLNNDLKEDGDKGITVKKMIRNCFTANLVIQKRHLPSQSSCTNWTLSHWGPFNLPAVSISFFTVSWLEKPLWLAGSSFSKDFDHVDAGFPFIITLKKFPSEASTTSIKWPSTVLLLWYKVSAALYSVDNLEFRRCVHTYTHTRTYICILNIYILNI